MPLETVGGSPPFQKIKIWREGNVVLTFVPVGKTRRAPGGTVSTPGEPRRQAQELRGCQRPEHPPSERYGRAKGATRLSADGEDGEAA
jgi:hypothetical protein